MLSLRKSMPNVILVLSGHGAQVLVERVLDNHTLVRFALRTNNTISTA
jgi:hypothetical protein